MTRVVYGTFVVIVAAFVVSNVWQVAVTIFGDRDSRTNYPKVGEACGNAIQAEMASIEKARVAAAATKDGQTASSTYASARKDGGGSDAKAACASDPNGTDALAALERLDRAAESHAVRDASEIGPMRNSARSFIRVP